ncbi:deoxyribodipyrimidine photo-lyase [Acuticoccus sp. M5D2P5]|uniref:deoxyribodipyrimidine photo-lyase n=1 Tax=Acuticoccus kalidii TaxID=2910977 RepID=UPI001F34F1BF|nr:deoxyribodipyrimidine photo-lyase [Acuticoccus kalidii]MCF3933206.1 deoxyribodipyrimidine photo-lyase [Acuticoccus kalidii]
MVHALDSRIRILKSSKPRQEGAFVLYWMQHSQRAEANPAFERAAYWANECGLPLLVLFVVDPNYPDGSVRHFTFMLEGLKETMAEIGRRGAHFALRTGHPPDIVCQVAQDAAIVVTDRGYLRHLVAWREEVADGAGTLVEEVEGDVIVPVAEPTDKMETAARTIRPKLHKTLKRFLELPPAITIKTSAKSLPHKDDVSLGDVEAFVASLGCDASVGVAPGFKGGTSEARHRLTNFLRNDLKHYGEGRADIVDRHVSHLSPYLHFGQISPLEIYQKVVSAKANSDSFIEEMLIRRELGVNFVYHTPNYDAFEALPEWAQDTLAHHAKDKREPSYSARELEDGKTDDPYWNAAMREMRVTGYLHNHMRMYWGKRILGWMTSPKRAFETTLHLNNKYFLDGRDTNSYANVAWIYGLHDRGWPERDVYGKVRTMTPSGLKRKFDIDAYVRWTEQL